MERSACVRTLLMLVVSSRWNDRGCRSHGHDAEAGRQCEIEEKKTTTNAGIRGYALVVWLEAKSSPSCASVVAGCVVRGAAMNRCVGNGGGQEGNECALNASVFAWEALESGCSGEANMKGTNIVFRPGMQLRLTRTLDKERGFMNGVVGRVHMVLSRFVCVLKLSNGAMLLLHPLRAEGGRELFLPCVDGSVTTRWRAQGRTPVSRV